MGIGSAPYRQHSPVPTDTHLIMEYRFHILDFRLLLKRDHARQADVAPPNPECELLENLHMKAALLREHSQPLVIEDIPLPILRSHEVLLKVKACGLCGTDLKLWATPKDWLKLPFVMGHEIAGEIAAVGTEVHHLDIGERGLIHFCLTCGECVFCRTNKEMLCDNAEGKIGFTVQGGLAEYLAAPARNFIPISSGLSFTSASIVCDAIATPYNALKKANIQQGDYIVVMGLGGLGIHAAQIAKVLGANVIGVDVDQRKLEHTRQLGIVRLIRYQAGSFIEEVRKSAEGHAISAILETVSTPATVAADLQLLGKTGKLILLGYTEASLTVPPLPVILNELSICGSVASSREDALAVLALIKDGVVTPVVSTTYPLEEVNCAIKDLKSGKCVGRQVITIA